MLTRLLRLIAGLLIVATLPIWIGLSIVGWLFSDHFFLHDWANWVVLGK